jgi:hypothetical protein
MNERIRELAEEAELRATLLFNKENLEKFAELIVKECLNELCEQMDKHNVDLSNLPSWYKALAKTEEHFGVK